MKHEDRINQISAGLDRMAHAWPFVAGEIEARIASRIEDLVNQDNEQTRGQIKALRWVLDLPSALRDERDGMSAALADEAAAN